MAKRRHNSDQRSLMIICNDQYSAAISPLLRTSQQWHRDNALYTSGRSIQVGKRVQNYVWLFVDLLLDRCLLPNILAT